MNGGSALNYLLLVSLLNPSSAQSHYRTDEGAGLCEYLLDSSSHENWPQACFPDNDDPVLMCWCLAWRVPRHRPMVRGYGVEWPRHICISGSHPTKCV